MIKVKLLCNSHCPKMMEHMQQRMKRFNGNMLLTRNSIMNELCEYHDSKKQYFSPTGSARVKQI